MENLKLSVFLLTYNQIGFIRQCLDGVVSQNTSFDFEVIVHDDCSNDGTREVIEEYASKYSFIKPIFEEENQFQKGNISEVIKKTYSACNGEYVALLEGDDYWIDENKLQLQVNFLDKHPDFSGCFHQVLRKNVITGQDDGFVPNNLGKAVFDIKDTLNEYFIGTCSVVYRLKKFKDEFLEMLPENIVNSDTYTIYYFSIKGKIGYIDKLMSVKTINESGIWNSVKQSEDDRNVRFATEIVNFPIEVEKLLKRFQILLRFEYPYSVPVNVLNSALTLERYDIIQKIAERFPNVFRTILQRVDSNDTIKRRNKRIRRLKYLIYILGSLNLILILFFIYLFLAKPNLY